MPAQAGIPVLVGLAHRNVLNRGVPTAMRLGTANA